MASHGNTGLLLASASLWRREVIRFLRQRSRVIGALGTPLVFWVLIGCGLRNSFRLTGESSSVNYLEYAYPGSIVLIVLFTAIFAMISIIDDRKEGFMQAVLAAPISRSAIVLGKVLGSTTLAVAQASLFLLLAPIVGLSFSVTSLIVVVGVIVLISLGLSALGFLFAWPMDSTQGFHAVMNLVLMPMWLLSGAFFPASGASKWVGWVMAVNPLSYGVAALRHVMYPQASSTVAGLPSLSVSLGVTVGFTVLMFALCVRMATRRGV